MRRARPRRPPWAWAKVEAKPALSRAEAPPERRKRVDESEYLRRIFVGGLPPTVTEEEFKVRAG